MGILQARMLEWVAVPFSRGLSQLRDGTQVSHIAGGFSTIWATREAQVDVSFTKEYWEKVIETKSYSYQSALKCVLLA